MHLYYTGETEGLPTISFNNRASEMTSAMLALDKTVKRIKCRDFNGRAKHEKICENCDIRHFCGKI
jgi:DNA helicase-2/ATP-dependent DNA helicase PcrA